MADQPSSTAAMKSKKKGGKVKKLFRDLIKRPKSANDSASQSNSTPVSVSSAFDAHDLAPGNDAGGTKSSSKYIWLILVLLTRIGLSLLLQFLLNPSKILHQLIQISWVPPWAKVRITLSPCAWMIKIETHLKEGLETNLTIAEPTHVPDWKAATKEGLGVASRFLQTLLKRLPECVDGNPVKVAFSVAKVIIDVANVRYCLCISGIGWLLNQAVGGNKDELAQRLEDTANRLLVVERTVDSGIPKGAEVAMEKLKS